MGVTLIDLLIADESQQEKEKEEKQRPRVHAPIPAPKPIEKKETPPSSDRGLVVIDIMGDE
jgi:hypothetical protein